MWAAIYSRRVSCDEGWSETPSEVHLRCWTAADGGVDSYHVVICRAWENTGFLVSTVSYKTPGIKNGLCLVFYMQILFGGTDKAWT